MRAIIEFLFVIIFVWVARAILRSLLSGISQAGSGSNRTVENGRPTAPLQGADLHKDPVCGTYVVASTRFQRQIGAERFYYCSEECQEKHALVGR
jgi:YHS domain-containing protein